MRDFAKKCYGFYTHTLKYITTFNDLTAAAMMPTRKRNNEEM